MLKVICIIIIIFIIIQNLLECSNKLPVNIIHNNLEKKVQFKNNENQPISSNKIINNKDITFNNPNPWTRIIINENNEFPYNFHIKLKISSLNDYENWKNIIPNLNFNSKTGELIIPSKDEPSALAIANLISINIMGNMTIKNILEKNLIQISINKCKNYEVVQNKLREQLYENLYGVKNTKLDSNYENDLINIDKNKSAKIDFVNLESCESRNENFVNNKLKLDTKQESNEIKDTYNNYSYNNYQQINDENDENIETFEGNNFSYI